MANRWRGGANRYNAAGIMTRSRFQPVLLLILFLCATAQVAGYGVGMRLCVGCDATGAVVSAVPEQDGRCCPDPAEQAPIVPDPSGDPDEDRCRCLDVALLDAGIPSGQNTAGDSVAVALIHPPVFYERGPAAPSPGWADRIVRPPPRQRSPVSSGTVLRL